MSLYHKYRPTTLEELRGNEEIISSVANMLSNIETCPHAFLFHGTSGCGKTTIGRIIADRLESKGSDFREIDSADFRGIDTIREIRKHSQFKPIESKRRVWLIDECHKMTNDAQNALLKILEDPPPYVYFILCTTEPQKLLPTIKGRCSQFQVQPLSDPDMMALLRHVVKSEEATMTKEIYNTIITNSYGQPRNALQILEQVLNVPFEKRVETAKKVEVETNETIELCRALVKKAPWGVVSKILEGLKTQEPESIRRIVLGYCQAVLLKTDNPHAAFIIEQFWEPTYDIGFPYITYACYAVTKN